MKDSFARTQSWGINWSSIIFSSGITTYTGEPVDKTPDPEYYTCLNCGTELKCTTEKTCKAVEKPKKKVAKKKEKK